MNNNEYIKCYLSEIGHNNFWYPSQTKALISCISEYKKLNWISGAQSSKLIAIKVRKSSVLPLKFNENTTKNTSPPGKDIYTVVWIKNDSLSLLPTN